MPPYKRIVFPTIAAALWLSNPFTEMSTAKVLSLSGYVLLFSSLQLVVWGLWRWLVYPKLFSPLRRLPQPTGNSFFMGQAVLAGLGRSADPMRRWVNEVPNEGIIMFLDVFNVERILVVSPKALAEVLVHKAYDFEKPRQVAKLIGRVLGIGVLLAEGHAHKVQRKNLQPAFAFRHIKELYPIFWAKSKGLVAAVSAAEASGNQGESGLDLNDWASRTTLDIIGVAGFGEDFRALQDPGNKLSQTYKNLFAISRGGRSLIRILRFVLPTWVYSNLPVKRNKDVNIAADAVREASLDLVRRAKRRLDEGKDERNIVSIALASGAFTEDEMVNQMMTFLLAGHETTASAFGWAVCMLCKYPHIQALLRKEVQSRLPDPRKADSQISSDDIDKLPYLNAFCNETLRLFPPVILTMRVAAVDTSILGQPIPKGTHITAVPWAVNTSKELWGDTALDFDPDRWLKHNLGGAESNYSFLTFLHGPRSCIGQSFAQGELKCLVTAWVGAFETKFADEGYVVRVQNGITAKPKDLRVKVNAVGP